MLKINWKKLGFKPGKRIEDAYKADTIVYAEREEIGRLSDYFIDFRGYVKAIEVSRSFLDDLFNGRRLETEFGTLAFQSSRKGQKKYTEGVEENEYEICFRYHSWQYYWYYGSGGSYDHSSLNSRVKQPAL